MLPIHAEFAQTAKAPTPARGPAPALGIVMLDTNFTRPLGDAGNAASWPFPVEIVRVPRAHAKAVVENTFSDYQLFQSTFENLGSSGVSGVISTCGFLARLPQLNGRFRDAAVCASTLFKYAKLAAQLPSEKRIAILTVDAAFIDDRIRENCGIPRDAIIASPTRTSHFCRAILDGSEPLNVETARAEWVAIARETQSAHPNIGLWLFECANLPPYRQAVIDATGVPVYDALHLGIETYFEGLAQHAVSLKEKVPDRADEVLEGTSSS